MRSANTFARLTGTQILLITAAWLLLVFFLHGAGLFVAFRQLQRADSVRLAAVGFDVRRLLLELLGPPLALAAVWVVARFLSTHRR